MKELWIGIGLISIGVGMLAHMWEFNKLKRKVKNLERHLKDFDVIPQAFDSSKSL
jgi:hypothetical protein